MKFKILSLSCLAIMLTSGCSGTYNAYYQTLKLAFSEQPDAEMLLSDIQQSAVDVISIKRGTRAKAIMALAYLENGKHKWVSKDNAMLIMEKGRLVRTVGLKENLLYLSDTESDPLKSLPSIVSNKHWRTLADLSGDQYGYPLESSFSEGKNQKLDILSLNIDAILFMESIHYLAPTNVIRSASNWNNYFWYDRKSGELIKSLQTVSPHSEAVEITYLSRIARLKP